jgi:hypothetical protein
MTSASAIGEKVAKDMIAVPIGRPSLVWDVRNFRTSHQREERGDNPSLGLATAQSFGSGGIFRND